MTPAELADWLRENPHRLMVWEVAEQPAGANHHGFYWKPFPNARIRLWAYYNRDSPLRLLTYPSDRQRRALIRYLETL